MIYALPIEKYPKENQTLETIQYQDENDFEWRIARVENGFFVRYYGDEYFSPTLFCCEVNDKVIARVKNTNCIFIQDGSFEAFTKMRTLLKSGWTDDIWEAIENLFTERFEKGSAILESEKYK